MYYGTHFQKFNMASCTPCIHKLYIKYVANFTFFSKFIHLQLTGSYFCSVTGYDLLASFAALVQVRLLFKVWHLTK